MRELRWIWTPVLQTTRTYVVDTLSADVFAVATVLTSRAADDANWDKQTLGEQSTPERPAVDAREVRRRLERAFGPHLREVILGAPFDVAEPLLSVMEEAAVVPSGGAEAEIVERRRRLSRRESSVAPDWPGIKAAWRYWRCLRALKRRGSRAATTGLEAAGRERSVELSYGWVVFSRADYLWLVPHPPVALLDPGFLWIPDGQDYEQGLSDSHAVAPAALAPAFASRWDRMRNGSSIDYVRAAAERFLRLHLSDLHVPVARFLPVAFIACCRGAFGAAEDGACVGERSRCPSEGLAASGADESLRALLSRRAGAATADCFGAKYDLEGRTVLAAATLLGERGWRWRALPHRDRPAAGAVRLYPPCFARTNWRRIPREHCCDEARFTAGGLDVCFFAFDHLGRHHPAFSFDRCCAGNAPLVTPAPVSLRRSAGFSGSVARERLELQRQRWCWELLPQGGPGDDVLLCVQGDASTPSNATLRVSVPSGNDYDLVLPPEGVPWWE